MKKSRQKDNLDLNFIGFVILSYIITAIKDFSIMQNSLIFAFQTFIKLIPVFILVYIIMLLVNLLMANGKIDEYIEKSSGISKWLMAIIFGILSMGPIYMWHPALKEFQEKGISHGLIAVFLYAKAIKPAIFPVFIYYFGLEYVLIFTGLIIVFSVIQGLIINNLISFKKESIN